MALEFRVKVGVIAIKFICRMMKLEQYRTLFRAYGLWLRGRGLGLRVYGLGLGFRVRVRLKFSVSVWVYSLGKVIVRFGG